MFSCFGKSKGTSKSKGGIPVVAAASAAIVATGIGCPPQRSDPTPVEPKPKYWNYNSAGLQVGDQVWICISTVFMNSSRETYAALGYTIQQRFDNTCTLGTYEGDDELQPEGDGGRCFSAKFDIRGKKIGITFYTCDL